MKIVHTFNNNFSLKIKILISFITLTVVVLVAYGTTATNIYKSYIHQLAYRDLNQNTERLKVQIDSSLSVYMNISDYLYTNPTIKNFISKYSKNFSDMYTSYLVDFPEVENTLRNYSISNYRAVIYLSNPETLSDGYYVKYLTEYPSTDLLRYLILKPDDLFWDVVNIKENGVESKRLVIARAILGENNAIIGVINIQISLDTLGKMLNTIDTGKNGYYSYRLENGKTVLERGDIVSKRPNNLNISKVLDLNKSIIEINYSEELISKMGQDQYRVIVVITFFAIVFSILLTYILSRLTVSRILLFVRKLRNIHRDERYLAPIEGTDEIALIDKTFNNMLENIKEKVKRENQLENEKKVMESELLFSQFNPHFLYNTLSALRWSAIEKGDEEAAMILDKLVSFYRALLSGGKSIVRVAKEVEMIRDYVGIQGYTYDECYSFEYKIDPGVEELYCLKCILQPIVENAIYHAFDKRNGGKIVIFAGVLEDRFVFTIEDNGKGMEQSKLVELNSLDKMTVSEIESGFGIYNVIRRIKLYYGNGFGLRYESTPGAGTKATITLPVCKTEKDNLVV